jgi:amino-acid N-acetyltransferase
MNSAIRKATANDLGNIMALLKKAKLPVEDLESRQVTFHVLESNQQLLACLGMEKLGKIGLLRSFAVTEGYRNSGLGRLLFAEVMKWNKEQAFTSIYLLTTTAALFFSKNGFEKIPRTEAPLEIQLTSEFSSICPSSATLMKFTLPC